jgi:hypothetical protein
MWCIVSSVWRGVAGMGLKVCGRLQVAYDGQNHAVSR